MSSDIDDSEICDACGSIEGDGCPICTKKVSKEERNKFLTEAVGECWHDQALKLANATKCSKCKKSWFLGDENINNDFFTWPGFGKLREFYDAWTDEKRELFWRYTDYNIPEEAWLCDHIWHKDHTANLMYGFLKSQSQEEG